MNEHSENPSPRMHHSSIVENGIIWIFGGRTPEMDGLSDLYSFNIIKNKWRKINTSGDIPSPRWAHSMTKIDSKRFLIYGGCSSCEYFNDLYEFHLGLLRNLLF